MATNSAFVRPAFGADSGHSWADEDDLDIQPLSLAPQLATYVLGFSTAFGVFLCTREADARACVCSHQCGRA